MSRVLKPRFNSENMTITTKIIPPISADQQHHQQQINFDPYLNNLDLDILIVGAGFSGIYLLYNLRKKGYKVKIFEAANGLGGTWRVNHYPGARVDSDQPVYELSIPEIWKEWNWKEKYPGWKELQQYFHYCDKILDIKKDVSFNTKVMEANFDKDEGKWMIKSEDGKIVKAKYFLPCIGFAAKRYIPDFPGIETFKGEIHHSSEWPESEVDVAGKRCAVIGTGSTGVQIIQEFAKKAKSLVVFQRTPNLCLPMAQRNLSPEEQKNQKHGYPNFFLQRTTHFGGFVLDFLPRDTFDDSPEEREKVFEALWNQGNFSFWIGGYRDLFFNLEANFEAYNFWAKKVRAKIEDPKKRDILAPLKPPHPFGTKRPSLEQDYYQIEEAQEKWSIEIQEMANLTLFPLADSWYMGANIPGKKREMLNYSAGVPKYAEILKNNLKNNLEGYHLVQN
uniref:Flavin-containing monooxygenase n=1 Tax=Panagrolaimus sp. ES5 TaxID=591445 RepID=A0AC34FWL0_9BILA